jgi:hypothetical protein
MRTASSVIAPECPVLWTVNAKGTPGMWWDAEGGCVEVVRDVRRCADGFAFEAWDEVPAVAHDVFAFVDVDGVAV